MSDLMGPEIKHQISRTDNFVFNNTGRCSDVMVQMRLRNTHRFLILGEVRLQSKLDYETDQSYVLKISASDLSENPLSSECTLRVNVTDVNDNSPEFTSPYKVSMVDNIRFYGTINDIGVSR